MSNGITKMDIGLCGIDELEYKATPEDMRGFNIEVRVVIQGGGSKWYE